MGLQVAGDVGRTQHLATDVAGDFALMSDHVGAQTIFGGKGCSTCLWMVATLILIKVPKTSV